MGMNLGAISKVHMFRIDMLLFLEWFYVYYIMAISKYMYVGLVYRMIVSFVEMMFERWF